APVLLLGGPVLREVDYDAAVPHIAVHLDREVREQIRAMLAPALDANLLLEERLAGLVHALEERRHLRGDFGRELGERASKVLSRTDAIHSCQRVIHAQVAPVAVCDTHARRRIAAAGLG